MIIVLSGIPLGGLTTHKVAPHLAAIYPKIDELIAYPDFDSREDYFIN